jgi:hypothetical protein
MELEESQVLKRNRSVSAAHQSNRSKGTTSAVSMRHAVVHSIRESTVDTADLVVAKHSCPRNAQGRLAPVSAVCMPTKLTVSEAKRQCDEKSGRTWPVFEYNGANSDSQNGNPGLDRGWGLRGQD